MAGPRSHWRIGITILAALGLLFTITPAFAGSSSTGRSTERRLSDDAEGRYEALEAAQQYAEARTAPVE